MTVLMVTHDAGDARRIADRVLSIRNGRVEGDGAVEDMLGRAGFPKTAGEG
jgi:ABC-type thiamine transport system ATPase subunit